MKNRLTLLLVLSVVGIFAQEKGSIQGKILDKEMNNDPLPFANIIIKDSETGTTSGINGNYSLQVMPGTYTLIFSYVGYQNIEVANILVKAGNVTTLENLVLAADEGMSLKEVIVKLTVQRESVTALLTDQKKALSIKSAIGAEELTNLGVSDAAMATSKISGINQSEGSGDVFIRGLGDRYLTTTMNGLPIPSDNVDRKNIDLRLFSTNIIQNIGVSKAYNVQNYADQASGNVNIVTKEAKGKEISFGIGIGFNKNALDVPKFKSTQNMNDLTFGFYQRPMSTQEAITNQPWSITSQNPPINLNGSLNLNAKIPLLDKNLSVFITASHSNSYEHTLGEFRKFRSNILDNKFTDAETFNTKTRTVGLLNLSYSPTNNLNLKWNTLLINQSNDQLYESGRNLEGYVFDQDPSEFQAFIRDQNTRLTQFLIHQFSGALIINEKNKLSWGGGYNYLNSKEPNRIRNEVNTINTDLIEFSNVGDFQQRKSNQFIEDQEYNAYLKEYWTILKNEENNNAIKLNFGVNYRNKTRVLQSQFIGARARGLQVNSIDNLSDIFTPGQFPNSGLKSLLASYMGELEIIAPFAAFEITSEKFNASIGARYENINLDLPLWDVPNFVGRTGSLFTAYENFSPALNIRYAASERSNFRFSFSKTITLPEFKEIAPFEYNDPTGRVTSGNPDLIASTDYNVDLKYEFFPTAGQIISLGAFYKNIKDPINMAITRGSSGNFSYFNTGKKAQIVGLEFESRIDLIKQNEDVEGAFLKWVFNAATMWHNQDLFEYYQYAGKTQSDLQGASDFIANSALTYSNGKQNEFLASLSASFASDKIFSLGGPEDFANSAQLYNDEVVEKGFITLNLQLIKKINDHLSIKLKGENLFNPSIRQTQNIRNLNSQVETTETVLSYKKGIELNIGFNYTF